VFRSEAEKDLLNKEPSFMFVRMAGINTEPARSINVSASSKRIMSEANLGEYTDNNMQDPNPQAHTDRVRLASSEVMIMSDDTNLVTMKRGTEP
jgi:hypothetical protein